MTKPADDSFRAIHSTLLNIVKLSLDSDPALIPNAAKEFSAPDKVYNGVSEEVKPGVTGSKSSHHSHQDTEDGRDPDDFVVMSETQAKRIVSLSEMAFGVELSPDVVIADANVNALGRRVVGARSLVGNGGRRGG